MKYVSVRGTIKVFPKDRSRIKNKKKPYEEQTIIVDISDDIGRLYRSLLFKEQGIYLEPPPFGCHVTLNNGRTFLNVQKHSAFLKALDGSKISILIDVSLYRYWEFYAVPVIGKELNKIREKLELPFKDDFHITIGRLHPSIKKEGCLLTKTI